MTPLITRRVHDALLAGARAGATVDCSLDLDRTTVEVRTDGEGWAVGAERFPFIEQCKDRTIYYWTTETFQPAARFSTFLCDLLAAGK